MNRDRLLAITSLLTALLLSFHLTDDIVRGFEPGGPSNITGIVLLAIWLCAILLLNGRLAGYIIMLVFGLLSIAVPVIHMQGAGMVGGRIVGSSGIFFWVWTMIAAGAIGPVSAVIAALGLWDIYAKKCSKETADTP